MKLAANTKTTKKALDVCMKKLLWTDGNSNRAKQQRSTKITRMKETKNNKNNIYNNNIFIKTINILSIRSLQRTHTHTQLIRSLTRINAQKNPKLESTKKLLERKCLEIEKYEIFKRQEAATTTNATSFASQQQKQFKVIRS